MPTHVKSADKPAEVSAALASWVHRHRGEIRHERRVEELAAALFDLTRPLHGLGQAERDLLGWAALVHDIGRALEDDDHELHGAVMLDVAADLPLTDTQRRRLMFLTRYHRGKVPAQGAEEYLRLADERTTARTLLGLLRAADGLDSRSLHAGGAPRVLMTLRNRCLAIGCYVPALSPRTLRKLGKKKKFLLLEEMLHVRVAVEIADARAIALVA